MLHSPRLLWLVGLIAAAALCRAECPHSSPADPCIATFDGGDISLSRMEEFARELPNMHRCPTISDAAKWREFVCSELAKDIICTTRALSLGYHRDPAYVR